MRVAPSLVLAGRVLAPVAPGAGSLYAFLAGLGMIHLAERASKIPSWPFKLAMLTMTVSALTIWGVAGFATILPAMGLTLLLIGGAIGQAPTVLVLISGCFVACSCVTISAHRSLRAIGPILATAAGPSNASR